jgi:hypothetical protein
MTFVEFTAQLEPGVIRAIVEEALSNDASAWSFPTGRPGPSDNVVNMALCSTEHVFLKPNQLYRFYQHPTCKRCAMLAAYSEGKNEQQG